MTRIREEEECAFFVGCAGMEFLLSDFFQSVILKRDRPSHFRNFLTMTGCCVWQYRPACTLLATQYCSKWRWFSIFRRIHYNRRKNSHPGFSKECRQYRHRQWNKRRQRGSGVWLIVNFCQCPQSLLRSMMPGFVWVLGLVLKEAVCRRTKISF